MIIPRWLVVFILHQTLLNTMRKSKLFTICALTIGLLQGACKRDQLSPQQDIQKSQNVEVIDGRLNFVSEAQFLNCMDGLKSSELKDASSIIEQRLGKKGKFLSLRDYKLKTADQFEVNHANTNAKVSTTSEDEEQEEDDDALVPDPHLASILNTEREIQVEGMTYKITKYGTYICNPDKIGKVRQLLNDLEAKNIVLSKDQRKLPGEVEEGEDIYFVDEGIYRFDSYKYTNTIDISPKEENVNGSIVSYRELPQGVYDKFPTYEFDSKTWAGQILQSIFGRTKPHHEYFDRKHRVKVNFYNVNYGFFSSVGVNVKMQTKGWTGIWRKLNTEELRLGWDGLEIVMQLKNMPAPSVPRLDFGRVKLGSFEFPVKELSIAGHNVGYRLNDLLNDRVNDSYRNVLKYIWGEVKKIAPYQFEWQDQYVKAFRTVYPDKVKMILGRTEIIAWNTNQISKNFDWHAGFTIRRKLDGSSSFGRPEGSAYKYTIQKGAVYGAAKYGGQWKGVRIDKR